MSFVRLGRAMASKTRGHQLAPGRSSRVLGAHDEERWAAARFGERRYFFPRARLGLSGSYPLVAAAWVCVSRGHDRSVAPVRNLQDGRCVTVVGAVRVPALVGSSCDTPSRLRLGAPPASRTRVDEPRRSAPREPALGHVPDAVSPGMDLGTMAARARPDVPPRPRSTRPTSASLGTSLFRLRRPRGRS